MKNNLFGILTDPWSIAMVSIQPYSEDLHKLRQGIRLNPTSVL